MTRTTGKGATVEVAISAALQALGAKREEVEIEVIDQGKKGFLGFGAREAEVAVTFLKVDEPSVSMEETQSITDEKSVTQEMMEVETDSVEVIFAEKAGTLVQQETIQVTGISDGAAIEETEQYLKDIANGMGINDLHITHETDGKYVTFQLESEKAAMLIGKRGQTLNALQQLTQLIANKKADQFKVVRIDVGDYRERREQSLEQLAERMADKAVRTGRKVQLEPMPSYERKVIHNALSSRLDIETYSEGTDPHRHLVIEAMK